MEQHVSDDAARPMEKGLSERSKRKVQKLALGNNRRKDEAAADNNQTVDFESSGNPIHT